MISVTFKDFFEILLNPENGPSPCQKSKRCQKITSYERNPDIFLLLLAVFNIQSQS